MYCGISDMYLNVYRSGRVFCLGGRSQRRVLQDSRHRTVGMVDVWSKIAVQFAGRASKSHVRRKRGFLYSWPRQKHGWWLAVLVVSISPVSARPFFSSRGKSSRGNGGAKEQAQRDGQAEMTEEYKGRGWRRHSHWRFRRTGSIR